MDLISPPAETRRLENNPGKETLESKDDPATLDSKLTDCAHLLQIKTEEEESNCGELLDMEKRTRCGEFTRTLPEDLKLENVELRCKDDLDTIKSEIITCTITSPDPPVSQTEKERDSMQHRNAVRSVAFILPDGKYLETITRELNQKGFGCTDRVVTGLLPGDKSSKAEPEIVKVKIKEEEPDNEVSKSCCHCDKCGKGFFVNSDLLSHACPKSRKTLSIIKKNKVPNNNHNKTRVQRKPFTCPDCGKHFHNKHTFEIHQRSHTGEKPFTCTECGKSFYAKSILHRHLKVHTGEKPFTCTDCGKSFSQMSNLFAHNRVHTGEKPFACIECGKSFSAKYQLHTHHKVHTGEKPFTCTECGKCFALKSSLCRHLRVHTGEKPFMCTECGKSFSQLSNLYSHIKFHTGVKPFSCSECGKKFTLKNQLLTHQKVHMGPKQFPCTECGKIFSLNSSLHRHLTVHKKKLPKCPE